MTDKTLDISLLSSLLSFLYILLNVFYVVEVYNEFPRVYIAKCKVGDS